MGRFCVATFDRYSPSARLCVFVCWVSFLWNNLYTWTLVCVPAAPESGANNFRQRTSWHSCLDGLFALVFQSFLSSSSNKSKRLLAIGIGGRRKYRVLSWCCKSLMLDVEFFSIEHPECKGPCFLGSNAPFLTGKACKLGVLLASFGYNSACILQCLASYQI